MTHQTLPEAVRNKGVLAVGAPGSGKSSNTAEAMIIPDLESNKQVVIIDPTDAWFGLALSKSGKEPSGYPITVFGGEHGSVQLTPNMGKAMGYLLGKEPVSAVLSIWHFSLQEQITFVSEFCAAIMEVNRKPIRVVFDEADEFIPQKPELGNDLLKCKLRAKRIVTRGRKSGFRPVLITQRPQALDTAVRNLCQVIMAFQSPGHHERTQIEDYVKSNGDPKQMQDMLSSLSGLQIGEAWVWAPREKYLKRIQFPMLTCYDSFKEIDEDSANIKTVPVSDKHLKHITAALAEFEEQRKANDPELLRKRLKDMEREVATLEGEVEHQKKLRTKALATPNKHALDEASAAGYFDGLGKGWKAGWRDGYGVGWQEQTDAITKVIKANTVPANMVIPEPPAMKDRGAYKKPPASTTMTVNPFPHDAYRSAPPPRPARKAPVGPLNPPVTVGAHDRTGPERKILAALAEWKAMGFDRPSRTQLAALCDYHPRTPAFTNPLSALRTAGDIDYESGAVWLTDAGLARVEIPTIYSADELHEKLRGFLNGPQRKIFDFLVAFGTANVSRQEIADALNYHVRTPAFTNPLSALRSRDILDYGNGFVHLRPWVFMEQWP